MGSYSLLEVGHVLIQQSDLFVPITLSTGFIGQFRVNSLVLG